MLNDFTLDMWVPIFRWIDAHRMHKKMPNYIALAFYDSSTSIDMYEYFGRMVVKICIVVRGEWDVHSMMPSLFRKEGES